MEDVAGTAPHRAADAAPDALAQFDLERNHAVVGILTLVVAAHALAAAHAGKHRPRRTVGVEFTVEVDGQDAVAPHPLVEVGREVGAPERLPAVAHRFGIEGLHEADVDTPEGVRDEVARVILDDGADARGRVAGLLLHAVEGDVAQVRELLALGVVETEHAADEGVGQHAIEVAHVDVVALLDEVALFTVGSGPIPYSPDVARLRLEVHRVVDAAAVLREDVVARDAHGVEARDGDAGEDGDVRGRGDRVAPVEPVESGGQYADAQAGVFRVAGTAGEGEVDFLLEGLVGGRLAEVVDNPAQERRPSSGQGIGCDRYGRCGCCRRRGIGIVQRIGVAYIDAVHRDRLCRTVHAVHAVRVVRAVLLRQRRKQTSGEQADE